MYFGMYDSAREMKKVREADIAFHLRRKFRRIRAEARVIDPNAGFRADQQRREEQQRIAQINARDHKLALKEAGTTRLPSRQR